MDSSTLTTILGVIGTAVILPLIVDWIKRSWEYNSSIHAAKIETITELSKLLWEYHTKCANLYSVTYPLVIKGQTKKQIIKNINDNTPAFWNASNALFTGLYDHQSRIRQYYDHWKKVDEEIEALLNWVYYDETDAMDDHIILLSQGNNYTDKNFRAKLDKDFKKYQDSADRILRLLAAELHESSSFWYPIRRQFLIS